MEVERRRLPQDFLKDVAKTSSRRSPQDLLKYVFKTFPGKSKRPPGDHILTIYLLHFKLHR